MKKVISGLMGTLLLVGLLTLTFNIQTAKAGGTIFIRADGSVDPPAANIISADNVTYTFTDNINDSIVVERSNIIIDGNGHTVQGTGAYRSTGVLLSNVNNVTIMNTNTEGFSYGVYLNLTSHSFISGNNITNNEWYGINLKLSSYNTISGNKISDNHDGIILDESSNHNSISGNNITENKQFGIWTMFDGSSNHNSISRNNITENGYSGVNLENSSNNSVVENTFRNDGLVVFDSHGNIVEGNVVNGKPLVYLEGVSNSIVDEAGQVILIDCNNIVVENLNLSNIFIGMCLQGTNNSKIANNKIWTSKIGIFIVNGSSNIVSGNNITENNCGIQLEDSSNNSVSENSLVNNYEGITLWSGSANNSVLGNTIINNNCGISFYGSTSNAVLGNTIMNNRYGIEFYSSKNSVFHNNFVDNIHQVHVGRPDIVNYWDDGYPSGGNYWSDYNGTDSDNDAIGDNPYEINENNVDHFPLVDEFHKYHILWIEPGFTLTLISNSTISDFGVFIWIEHPEYRTIYFNVAGETGYGFCRLCIPKNLIAPPYTVTIDNGQTPVTYYNETLFDNNTHRWIYFAYFHSEHQVEITPEFPSFLILPLFIIATLLTVIVYKKKHAWSRATTEKHCK